MSEPAVSINTECSSDVEEADEDEETISDQLLLTVGDVAVSNQISFVSPSVLFLSIELSG